MTLPIPSSNVIAFIVIAAVVVVFIAVSLVINYFSGKGLTIDEKIAELEATISTIKYLVSRAERLPGHYVDKLIRSEQELAILKQQKKD